MLITFHRMRGNSLESRVWFGKSLTKTYYESLQPGRGELQSQPAQNSEEHRGDHSPRDSPSCPSSSSRKETTEAHVYQELKG